MATQIKEPIDNNPDTNDWQQALYKLTVTTGGQLLIDLTKTANVVAGTRLEVNGTFYETKANEPIVNFGIVPDCRYFWVYAKVTGDVQAGESEVDFEADQVTEPTWQVEKGGWFDNHNRRAVAYCYKDGEGELYNWVTVDRKEIDFEKCTPKFTDDISKLNQVVSVTGNDFRDFVINRPTWLYCQLKGGGAKAGGRGRYCTAGTTQSPPSSPDSRGGEYVEGWLFTINTVRASSGSVGAIGGDASSGANNTAGTGGVGGKNTGYPLLDGGNGQPGIAQSQTGNNTTVRSKGGGGSGAGAGSVVGEMIGEIVHKAFLIARGAAGVNGTVNPCTHSWTESGGGGPGEGGNDKDSYSITVLGTGGLGGAVSPYGLPSQVSELDTDGFVKLFAAV